ncbi:hypothetical protein J6590_080287 [Homalodisca vitripennis]|nr:hypothetical protein J6590_080287 [Homalodisca vitripennis]
MFNEHVHRTFARCGRGIRETFSSNFQPHFRKVKPSILAGSSLRDLLPKQEFDDDIAFCYSENNINDIWRYINEDLKL